MTVRAKVTVSENKEVASDTPEGKIVHAHEVKMWPVASCSVQHATPEEEDACEQHSYSKWTPAGEIRLSITNPRAYEQFQVGQSYYVDFTPAQS